MRLQSHPVLSVSTLVLAIYWNTGTANADHLIATPCKRDAKDKEETAPHKVEVKEGSSDFIEVKLGTLKCTKFPWVPNLFHWTTSSCTAGGVTWNSGEGHYFKDKGVYISCNFRGTPARVTSLAGHECSADDIREGTIELDTPIGGYIQPIKVAKVKLSCKDHPKEPNQKVWTADSCEIDGEFLNGGDERTTRMGTYSCDRLDQPMFLAKLSKKKKIIPSY